jgi:hypothetical protein
VLTTRGYVGVGSLKPGDKLLVVGKNGHLVITKFCTYMHYDPQLDAEFLTLRCDNLRISANHLLPRLQMDKKDKGEAKSRTEYVPAHQLAIGDSLLFVDDQLQNHTTHPKLIEIDRMEAIGVYSPLTTSGTLIVDGFQTSCYAEVGSHKLAHTVMAPLRFWSRNFNHNATKPGEIPVYARGLTAVRDGLRI